MEVLVQIDARDLIQDVDDGMGVTVRDAAVVFIAIPAVRLWTPYCEWHNKNTHFYRRKYPTLLCLKAFYRYTESVIKILRLRRDNDYAGGRYENNDSNVIQERV